MTDTPDHAPARIAFIGAGGIAKTHAGAAKSLNGEVEIVAAADVNAEATEAFAKETGAKTFASPDALYNAVKSGDLKADAVFVCTPPSVRRAVIEPALNLGLDVLLEKPLAMNLAQAEEIASIAADSDRIVGVGYCHRFTPAVLEMKRRVAAGDIGRLSRFENVFAFHHPPMSERWFSDPALSGGGSFIDTGCHSLDLFQFLVGEPRVAGAIADFAWDGRGESSATALVQAASGDYPGVAGTIFAGWLEAARFQIRLVGSEGTLFYDYEKPEELFKTLPDGKTEVIPVETHDVRFARQLGAFATAVATRQSVAEAGLASASEGLIVAKAVDSVHDSARLYNLEQASSPEAASAV